MMIHDVDGDVEGAGARRVMAHGVITANRRCVVRTRCSAVSML